VPADVTPLSRGTRIRIWVRRIGEGMTIAIALGLLLLWCSVPDVGKLARENPVTTAFIELRKDQAHAQGTPFALRWTWRPLPMISKYLRAAVVYAEDARFFEHAGVDWEAVSAAAEDNFRVGGSTITQQLAKNLYLSPERSIIRKVREMWIAYALEDHLDKRRILELYLNVVEWGDGVFGAEAAARHWYHKSAAQLTPAQAARLAVALPNPRLRSPAVVSAELDRKAARILRLMRRDRIIEPEQRQDGMTDLGLRPDPVPVPVPVPEPVPDQGSGSGTGTGMGPEEFEETEPMPVPTSPR
jgi:monofunctional biosynthetic peptidoglycan transglycosylase